MPIIVEERHESREATLSESPTIDLLFWIAGTDNEQDAGNALLMTAPSRYGPLYRESSTVKRIGDLLWDGQVRYGLKKPDETGDSTWSFSTGGGTQKITQSLGTTKYAPAGQQAPDCKNAINVTKDSVEGVDITVPHLEFSETHFLAAVGVTWAYVKTLATLTGRVNAAAFRSFAAGEVLFLGADGTRRGDEDWSVTFKFSSSQNAAGLSIGNITGIAKLGWDYLWVRYEDKIDADAGLLVKQPRAVYVETVYPSGDFSLLGIG